MRLLINTINGLVRTYRIDPNNGSITGWFLGNWHINQLNLPKNISYDCHFTYPKDGKYHISIKSEFSIPEEYINVFSDCVTIKTIELGIPEKKKISREEFENNRWYMVGSSVPTDDPPSFATVKHFQFPSLGFNVFKGDFMGSKIIGNIVSPNEVRGDDLIIDARELDKQSISCFGIIRGINEPERVSSMYKDWDYCQSIERKTKHVITQIICAHRPNLLL